MEQFLAEYTGLKQVSVPVDMNTAAITGERIKLDKFNRMAVILSMGDSTAAVVTFTLKQHNAAAAGTSKALTVANPYYHKVAAATEFTKVVPGAAASSYDLASLFADDPGIVVFEVLAEDLDNDNGYYWFSVDAADSTAAKLLGAVYVGHQAYQLPTYDLSL